MRKQYGFTLPEVIVVMGIVAVLFSLVFISFLRVERRPQLSTTVGKIVTELKNQQLKSMTGDTEGTGTRQSFGIKFEAGRYILFRGSTYVANDPANAPTSLESRLALTTTIPADTVIFAKGSGEIINFVSGADTITLTNIDNGDTLTVRFNPYGVASSLE